MSPAMASYFPGRRRITQSKSRESQVHVARSNKLWAILEKLERSVSGDDNDEVYRWAPADLGELEESAVGGSPGLSAVNDDVIQQFRNNNGTIVEGLFVGMRRIVVAHSRGEIWGAAAEPALQVRFSGTLVRHWLGWRKRENACLGIQPQAALFSPLAGRLDGGQCR
ncbi:hypothetical protein [Mycobacterium sp. 050134]|uniref:hypothetical protein n=1 Tax=Mycobacterium sp. 050134 TaxID=3096111 RepID=UPI002EDAE682